MFIVCNDCPRAYNTSEALYCCERVHHTQNKQITSLVKVDNCDYVRAILNSGCLHYKLANSAAELSLLRLGLALVLALAALAFRSCFRSCFRSSISITDSRLFLNLLSVTREANQLVLT
jgi:hypothetical protein